MSPVEFRAWLRGLLMGLAKGPVDDAIIRLIEDNLPRGPVTRQASTQVIPPPPADDPEAVIETEAYAAPPQLSPEDIRNLRRGSAPAKAPAARRAPRRHSTKVGTDADLLATSGDPKPDGVVRLEGV